MPGTGPDHLPTIGDGVIVLRCLGPGDVADHLAGEDEQQIRWFSGGPSSVDRVAAWIADCQHQWKTGGPRRNVGIRDARTGALIGNAEAHLALDGLAPGEVNLSYAVFARWRGRGIATRAVLLLCARLRNTPACTTAVIRVDPDNTPSQRVPRAAGFTRCGTVVSPDGDLLIRYVKDL